MIPSLETARLRLVAPSACDFDAYTRFYGDADASAFYGGPMSPAQAWRRLALDIGHWALRGYGMWSLKLREDAETIGGCGLFWPEGWPR